jgi:hypothetical protein
VWRGQRCFAGPMAVTSWPATAAADVCGCSTR